MFVTLKTRFALILTHKMEEQTEEGHSAGKNTFPFASQLPATTIQIVIALNSEW
jgi:hypothetical protein